MNHVGLSSREKIITILFANVRPTSHQTKTMTCIMCSLSVSHVFCRGCDLQFQCLVNQQIDDDEDDRCLAHVFANRFNTACNTPLLDPPSANWTVWGETKPVLLSSWVCDIPDPCIIGSVTQDSWAEWCWH